MSVVYGWVGGSFDAARSITRLTEQARPAKAQFEATGRLRVLSYTHEWRGQRFEDELELAYAVLDGVAARPQEGGYQAKRCQFPSKWAPA